MKNLLLSVALFLITLIAMAQDTVALKRSAVKMSEAFFKTDLNTLAFYTHPKIVAAMGGKEKMAATIKAGMESMKKQGASFRSASIGAPGQLFRTPKHIYCLLPHAILMNYQNGYLEAESSVLGISDNNGKTWKFVSAGNVGRAKLKSLFPDLPSGLEIPEQSRAVFHQN